MTARIAHRYILSVVDMNLAEIGTDGATWYDIICAHNLCALYYIDKLPTDSRALFYYRKMCGCTQISYEKCDDVSEYSCEKM